MAKVEPPKPYLKATLSTPNVSPEHEEAMRSLRERLSDVTPAQQAWITDACLLRYLRARDFKLDAAEKLLRGTLQWRIDYGVEDITPDEIYEEARSGKNYLHGSDKHGRPVIYQRPRRQNTKTYDLQVKQMAYLLERSVTSMDSSKGIEQHVLFIDFKGYSVSGDDYVIIQSVLSLHHGSHPKYIMR
eukprot:m.37401 g.37401  ORF g.37401 m.37401 type:complete len:187 (+) comp12497_c0_seq8:96-656(+)